MFCTFQSVFDQSDKIQPEGKENEVSSKINDHDHWCDLRSPATTLGIGGPLIPQRSDMGKESLEDKQE